jgi:hypothetical protein
LLGRFFVVFRSTFSVLTRQILAQHAPCYTLGRNKNEEHLKYKKEEFEKIVGVPLVQADRGKEQELKKNDEKKYIFFPRFLNKFYFFYFLF